MAETGENYAQVLTALLGETRLDPLPDGWFMAGSRPAGYAAGRLPQTFAYEGRRVMRLWFRAATPPGSLTGTGRSRSLRLITATSAER